MHQCGLPWEIHPTVPRTETPGSHTCTQADECHPAVRIAAEQEQVSSQSAS